MKSLLFFSKSSFSLQSFSPTVFVVLFFEIKTFKANSATRQLVLCGVFFSCFSHKKIRGKNGFLTYRFPIDNTCKCLYLSS